MVKYDYGQRYDLLEIPAKAKFIRMQVSTNINMWNLHGWNEKLETRYLANDYLHF